MADFRGSVTTQGYVILQKKLFDTFNQEADETAAPTILRILLHEISHLYGIGLENDEESLQLSRALRRVTAGSNLFRATLRHSSGHVWFSSIQS